MSAISGLSMECAVGTVAVAIGFGTFGRDRQATGVSRSASSCARCGEGLRRCALQAGLCCLPHPVKGFDQQVKDDLVRRLQLIAAPPQSPSGEGDGGREPDP